MVFGTCAGGAVTSAASAQRTRSRLSLFGRGDALNACNTPTRSSTNHCSSSAEGSSCGARWVTMLRMAPPWGLYRVAERRAIAFVASLPSIANSR